MAVRTAEDGEIEVKGPNVFLGYYKNPELTDEVLEPSGWLHTGDLGYIDDDGFLYITGRKKDLIITAGGKNVSPAPLESAISECPIVSHVVVVGDNKPFIGAVVTLDEEMTRSWLDNQGMPTNLSMDDLAHSDGVHAFIQQYVDKANANVSRAESVRKFIVLPPISASRKVRSRQARKLCVPRCSRHTASSSMRSSMLRRTRRVRFR